MMINTTDNNQFELPQAPPAASKKRKRNENQIYKGPRQLKTSTPIFERKYENPSFVFQNPRKSNANFFADPCLEIKSISDLLAASKAQQPEPAPAANPYEITRKPPKKKKRHDVVDSCFVNPALDLNGPEKAVNPYEVARQVIAEGPDHCFSNPGLNIRGPDHSELPSFVPFEIKRPAVAEELASDMKGIENLALEVPTQQQQQYALAVPFTPTLGRRINFNEISPSALTPCELLSKQLTIKDATPKQTPKVLSIISEEVDIGEELDCYQLELENSINEAKMERQTGRRRTMEARRVSSLSQKLNNLTEEDEEEVVEQNDLHLIATPKYTAKPVSRVVAAPPPPEPTVQPQTTVTKLSDSEISLNIKDASHHLDFDVKIKISDNGTTPHINADVEFEELDEDEEETFAKPAPFRRAYRKDPVTTTEQAGKEPEHADKTERKGVKSAIRSSIRRLMHPHTKDKTKEEPTKETKPTKDEQPGLFQAIRHSFRRNKAKQPVADAEHQNEKENVLEATIIDDIPRKLFRQPEVADVKRVEVTATDKVSTTANTFARVGSLRMRKQVMKSVFKKAVDEFDMK